MSNACPLEEGNDENLGVCCTEITENTAEVQFSDSAENEPEVEVSGVSIEDVEQIIGNR